MSTLKVGAITGVSASSDAITVANDGTCTANVTNNLSNRNIIINGAMQVAQRSGSSTVAVSDGSNEGYQTLDRFKFTFGNSAVGAANISQSTDAPTTLGFTKSHKTDVTTVNTTASGQQMIQIIYRIEGQDLRSSGWNHLSDSSFLTLSFYFKTNKTGTSKLPVSFRTRHGTNYYYVQNVTVTDPTNWNRYTVTIPGNSNLQIDDENTVGMDIFFTYYSGPDKDTGSEASWGSTNAYSTSDSTNYFDSTSNDMFITGVQLEVGSQATAFEHRSFGEELALCQRYYQVLVDQADTGSYKSYAIACCYSGSSLHHTHSLSPMMRTTPTLDYTTGSGYYRAYQNGTNDAFDEMTLVGNSHAHGVDIMVSTGLSVTQAAAALMRTANDNSRIAFSAEL